jgi:hypothetical protein
MKRVLWIGLVTIWTILVTLASSVTAFYTAFVVYAIVALGDRPWNFPGDPPIFDLLIVPAALSSVLALTLWLVLRRSTKTTATRFLASGILAAAIFSAATCGACAAGILERHDARWTAVRRGIREYGDAIAAAAGDKHHVLTPDEFERLHERFMPKPIAVDLPGFGTVHLRMAHGVYPYVGVDFGNGANALFDPRTMICTYSD